jgi:hypothetical protein
MNPSAPVTTAVFIIGRLGFVNPSNCSSLFGLASMQKHESKEKRKGLPGESIAMACSTSHPKG